LKDDTIEKYPLPLPLPLRTMYSPNFLHAVSGKKLSAIRACELPSDILTMIERYCFYTISEANAINQVKLQKKKMNALIVAAMSRNTVDFENHWAFGFPNLYDPPEQPYEERLQLQATNCSACGNYDETVTSFNPTVIVSSRIYCRCVQT
jgi:hypothetical protein